MMAHLRLCGILGWLLILLVPAAHATGGCDERLVDTVRSARALVSALPADPRAGELGADEVRWIREQLELIDAACLRGGDVEAAWRLEAILEHLKRVPPRAHLSGIQDGSATGAVASMATGRRGSRTVKVEPIASRLTTSTVPP
jgi:hypothetical protein